MTDNTQPEALRLAEQYDHGDPATYGNAWKAAICAELRRQHAHIAELEAQLEAVGAGGVQALSAAPAGFVPVAAFDRLHAHAESLAARLLAAEQAAPKAAPEAREQAAQRLRELAGVPQDDATDPLHPRYIEGYKAGHAAGSGRAAPQQEAQEPVAWQGVHDQTDLYYTKPAQADVRPLYTTTQPAPADVEVPSGWRFNVSRRDGRIWLTISTPNGASASLSAAENTENEDDTIVAQVLDFLADSLAAPATQAAPAAQGDAEDAARYRWLKSQASEELLNPRAARSEICADMRTHWKLPTLICSGPVGGYLDFDAAIDAAREWGDKLTSREAEIALLKKALLEAETAPQPAPAPLSDDTKRLDWLDRNIFSREMSDWDAKYGHGPDYNMWVIFSPKGAQGSARNIIDAAIAAQGGRDAG